MTPYPHYKPSHITWLGDIPEHWVEKRFKDITQIIQDGTHFTPTYTDQGINFLSVNDITRIPFDLSKSKYISVNEHNELIKRCRPQRGDILLSKNGTIGVPFLIDFDEEISIYVSLCLIRLKKQVDKKYFLFILLSDFMFEQYRINAKTNSVSNLHLDKLANFYTILPPLSEQAAIATYLDRKTQAIDKKIELLNQKITHYQHLRKTLINETVCRGLDKDVPLKDSSISWIGKIPEHWEVRRLKDLALIKGGQDQKGVLNDDGNYPVYGSGGIFGRADSYLSKKISVLLGRKGTIDKPLFVTEPFWTVDTMYFTEIRANVDPRFFYYLCLTIKFDFFQYGSAVPSMTQRDLSGVYFGAPKSKREQTAIAQYLDQQTQQIDHIVKNLQKQIELLRELRKTLINEVVTGKVQVVDL